ncbi:AraC family transcriptional regulator [Pokkaliibacter sp. MBI-7]|uniref:AraC family transcriptional regulator n=1 Tax=Pokkaliibacter sp. MBI-7 TaxID=3040600 RepID=UPI00244B7CCF|nr:AraC family transcriptional regulator [Pokkaliibacter sp. MBI-7]MDH2433696.1 AraC family transcriptional regulator [Pokkaliibacter sp. MBI-7]
MPSQDFHQQVHRSLISMLDELTRGQEDCPTAVPNLSLFRREAPAAPKVCLVEQSIVFVVQGEKKMWVEGRAYPYDRHRFLLTSLDIPAYSEVVSASPEQPCLGFNYKLDLGVVTELLAQGTLDMPAQEAADSEVGVGLGAVTPQLTRPFHRLLELASEPQAIAVIAPLIQREILFRVLGSEQGWRLRQAASSGSQSFRVARAIDWLKVNYRQMLPIEALADSVQMSPSSFYQHFRQLTGMSPLQYQKWLRLNEARRLMLSEHSDAASSAFQVGYESPSQFSREYRRLFGLPPKKDIESLRRAGESVQ